VVSVDHDLMTGAVVHQRGAAATDRDHVVLFATSPTASLPSAAIVGYRVDGARPSRHHLFDLEARREFHVRVDRAPGDAGKVLVTVAQTGPGATVASNDAGVLQFDLRGGEIHALP
jgi:hypothetical protein